MGGDGLRIGVQIIRKFVIRPARICFRSVYNHPFLMSILLMLLYLYRSFPFLFQLLVSASPVLVCTAVLLGTLLSFGEHNISTLIGEDEEKPPEVSELESDMLESRTVVGKDEGLGEDSAYTELISEIVERSFDEEPLLDIDDRAGKHESHGDLDTSSMPSYNISREIKFKKYSINEAINEFDSSKIGEAVGLADQKAGIEVGVGSSHESLEEGLPDIQRGMDDVLTDSFKADNLVNHETAERSIDNQIQDQLESSSGPWTQFDLLEDRLSSVKKIQVDNVEDYISGEGSLDAQIGSPLELSLGSWNHLDSDHDVDNESDSGSDGAESSSPDASMADIIPMLDELHPLLEDENPHTCNISCHGSTHSNDESDQQEEEEGGDVKSDGDDDNEEETREGKGDPVKYVDWTEEDQKNLMELGTSELERNQRLESLIARRRSRRMVTERNLLDLEGMDLSFPIAPISTTRYNPFDITHDSYGDLGLPPIPGSAPSVMVQRRNPFDLPYDSSEEKPDLTGDSFQEEFMELGQRESANQRLFRRNETFSVGSSMFDFGRHTTRASRFRPYFVPERTDSDVMSYSSFERQYSELSESRMSYSSLQRQSSELSESKASSIGDHDENKPFEHEFSKGIEFSPKIGHPSDYEEHGSHCSDDVSSLSDEGNDTKDIDHYLPVKEHYLKVNYGQSEREVGSNEVQFVGESIETNHSGSSSLSVPKERDDVKDEDDDRGFVNNQVHNLENADMSRYYSLETSVSDISADHSHKEPEFFGLVTEADESHPKEPIYDSSPLAIKRNPSSSSICSDLHRETSEVDLYHVQRDLFAENKSKIHDKDVKDNALQRRQEPDDGGCSANEVTEVTGHSSTGSGNSLASSMAEYDFHLIKDYSARELLNKELLDDKIPPSEADQVLTKGDNVKGHHASKLDTSVVAMSFEDGCKSAIDPLVALELKQVDILGDDVSSMDSNLFFSEVELKEETGTDIGVSEHFLASTSKNNHDDDASKELFFALDEGHFAPHDSLIYHPQKQVQSAFHINLEEFGQVNKVGETSNVLKVQEPEDNMLSSLLQNDESASQLEKLDKMSVSELAVEKIVQEENNNTIQGLDGSVGDELMYEENSNMREMDEELLSELDAVGDFSVKGTSLSLNKSYSDIPEEVVAEVHCSSEIQFGNGTSLVDITDVQNFESEIVTSEPNLAWSKESESDLHIRDANIDFLTLEDQSVEDIAAEPVQVEDTDLNELNLAWSKGSIPDSHIGEANVGLFVVKERSTVDIDAKLPKMSEEEVQEPVAARSIEDELFTMEVEATYVKKSELSVETTELVRQSTKAIPLIETTLNDKESVPEGGESKLTLPKGHVLESYRMEPEPRISVDTEKSELSVENFEDLETDIDKSFVLEALENTAEPGMGSEESLPLQVDTDIRDTQDAPSVQLGDQTQRSGSVDFKLFHPDIDIKKIVELPVLEECTSNSLEPGHQMERDRDVEEALELPVLDASIVPVFEFVDQRERVAFDESESLELDAITNEIQESPVECQIEPDGFREPESLLTVPAVEANISCDDESNDQLQKVGQLETEKSKIDEDFKGIQEFLVVDASGSSTEEPEDEKDHLLASQQKPEVSGGVHVVSPAIVSRSNEKEAGV